MGPDLGQLIHHPSDPLLLHHDAHGAPALLVQRRNGRRALARRDLRRHGERGPQDVVLAEHEALGGDDARDALGDEVDQLRVRGVPGLDEDGLGLDDGVEGHEAGSLHRLAGFWGC